MAPLRPRYSMKAYGGRKKPKPSLSFLPEDDVFENLRKGAEKKTNVFESSSERDNSSQLRTPKSELESVRLPDSDPMSPFQGINRGSNKVYKRIKPVAKTSFNKSLKKEDKSRIIQNCVSSDLYEVKSSTPKFQVVSRRYHPAKCNYSPSTSGSLSLPNVDLGTVKISPIARSSTLLDTGQNKFELEKPLSGDSSLEECGSKEGKDGSLKSSASYEEDSCNVSLDDGCSDAIETPLSPESRHGHLTSEELSLTSFDSESLNKLIECNSDGTSGNRSSEDIVCKNVNNQVLQTASPVVSSSSVRSREYPLLRSQRIRAKKLLSSVTSASSEERLNTNNKPKGTESNLIGKILDDSSPLFPFTEDYSSDNLSRSEIKVNVEESYEHSYLADCSSNSVCSGGKAVKEVMAQLSLVSIYVLRLFSSTLFLLFFEMLVSKYTRVFLTF